ncbi:MAG: MBL fold metallo-hydrolase [Oscillospiraceae bacterium]|jgi:glyoxylase-like metal-dependent hydrolase (beta-lactamase superfamily II)|nr:MBL fold metallo-hydrolase [Oscillospiraceae bacterium]
MQIQKITGGPLPTNCYFLTDDKTGQTAVIDPGFFDTRLEQAAQQHDVRKILLTHGHFDHITGVHRLAELTGAQIYMDAAESNFPTDGTLNLSASMSLPPIEPFQPNMLLHDGDTIPLGNLTIQVLHTPGHTCGGCCYLVGDALFSGDTVMCGTVGRTDFPTGSYEDIINSAQRIASLAGNDRVLPGHELETTLDWERQNNPYMEVKK